MSIVLDHIGIITATNDENAEVGAFFADVLGLPVEGDPADGYAEVATGGPMIALHRGSPLEDRQSPHGGTLLQFRGDDVAGFVEEVRGRGGVIVVEPHETDWGTLSTYVSGPHGILLEIYSPLPAQ
jgi:catechol 2,3-dioxygenase-like lactoylglutathione lyase family enzyme